MWCVYICAVLTRVQLFMTPWPIIACQAPLAMGFPRQEEWSKWSFPTAGDLPKPRIESTSPALAGRLFTTCATGKHHWEVYVYIHRVYTQTHIYTHIRHTYTHNGILLSHKKEWNSTISNKMSLQSIILSEISKRMANTVYYYVCGI